MSGEKIWAPGTNKKVMSPSTVIASSTPCNWLLIAQSVKYNRNFSSCQGFLMLFQLHFYIWPETKEPSSSPCSVRKHLKNTMDHWYVDEQGWNHAVIWLVTQCIPSVSRWQRIILTFQDQQLSLAQNFTYWLLEADGMSLHSSLHSTKG